MANPNESITSSFSVQNVSGSIYAFFQFPSAEYLNVKNLGGSIGVGSVQVGHFIDSAIISDFTNALSSAVAYGPSYTYG